MAIGRFYQRLPTAVNQDFQPDDPASARRCERLLRAVDARDAERIREDAVSIALRPLRFPRSAQFQLAIDGPSGAVALMADGRPTNVEIAVTATHRPPGAAQWMLTYNPDELAVALPGESAAVPPDKWVDFSLGQDATRLSTRSPPKRSAAAETSLTVSVRSGDKTEARRVSIRLPSPDVVDLVVRRTVAAGQRLVEGTDSFRLLPFPNRTNTYRLALVNRSRRARNVLVQWFPVGQLPAGRQPSRELLLDPSGSPWPGLKPIIGPLEMKLPASEDEVPIPFPQPKPAAADKAVEKAVDKGAAGPEAAAPAPLPSTGLACVIRDAPSGQVNQVNQVNQSTRSTRSTRSTGEVNQARWIKWIDLSPRPPKEYVTPRVRYDAREGQVHIDVRPGAADELPPLSAETPITVVWNTEGELGPDVAVKNEALIAAPDETASLYAT